MEFRKLERSSQTPPGWRLATVKEATDNHLSIDKSKVIDYWNRVRLLDGWMLGEGYHIVADGFNSIPCSYTLGVGYRGCLGYMLLVNLPTLQMSDSDDRNDGTLYSDVPDLSEEGKSAAFLLSCEDWNHDVLHWLLPAEHHHPSMPRKYDDHTKAASEVVSTLARKWQDVFEMTGNLTFQFSWKEFEKSFEELRVYIQGKWSEALMIINYRNSEQRKITDDILKELDLTEQRRIADEMFQEDMFEEVFDVVVEKMAWRTFCVLCSGLYDNVVMSHSHPASLPDLFHSSYSFLGDTTKEGTPAVKEVHASFKRFDEILGFPLSICKDKLPDVLATSLVRAAQSNNANLVKRLIQRGVQVTLIDYREGYTALHQAAINDNVEIAEMLLREDKILANVAEEYFKKRTPLYLAAANGNSRMCAFLVHHNANLIAKDYTGYTPLHIAIEAENDEVVVVLLSKAEVEESIKGSTRLVDVKNDDGYTPLDIAIGNGDCDEGMVAWLLSQSGQPESYFAKLQLSDYLRESSRKGYVDLVQKLLDGGADPFQGDDEGKSSLHCAAECHEDIGDNVAFQIIEKLLFDKKQGSVNWGSASATDKYGRNVLHLAAFLGREKLCRKLLQVNKDLIDSKDRDGQTPLFYAAAGPRDNADSFAYVFLSEDKERKSISVRDFSQMTPLHVAAGRGNINMVRRLHSEVPSKEEYVVAADVLGQTALHKAARGGHVEVVKFLLERGANPLKERDCDAKTPLHFAAQADGEKAVQIAKLLLDKCETDKQKSLLLFASPLGKVLPNDELEEYLDGEKKKIKEMLGAGNSLIRVAARLGDVDMAVECVTRGANISLIRNDEWIASLPSEEEKNNVQDVLKKLRTIIEQANDEPALEDNLGRSPFAIGLAALFLNPFVKSPVTVGISGEWGMGKSSVMLQTESNLLRAAAQFVFNSSFQNNDLLGEGKSRLSVKGQAKLRKIVNAIDAEMGNGPHIMEKIGMLIKRVKNFTAKISKIILEKNKKQEMEKPSLKGPSKVKELHIFIRLHLRFCKFWSIIGALWEESAQLRCEYLNNFNDFLEDYKPKFHQIFKSLAIMDRSGVFEEEEESASKNQLDREMPWEEHSLKGSTPSILTVQYNAWHYRNETEAWAGLAVEITKELEATMTVAHKLRTSWIYNWKNRKNNIYFKIILPFFLALMVSIWFTIIVWLILDAGKHKDIKKLKYGGLPASMIVMAWGLGKSVLSFVKPISSQVVDYICLPDHSQKLGYHQKVIDDINFLKESLYYKSSLKWEVFASIWCCITWSWNENYIRGTKICKMPPTYGNKLRIIVFVDDLDRCEENVILQILSAINLVLATCKIDVILGMEKSMIKRAILRKYGNNNSKDNEELAEKYLRKIVQLPLQLPDPSDSESTNFLKRQLGKWERSNSKAVHEHVKGIPKLEIVSATQPKFPPDGEGRKQHFEQCIARLKEELAHSEGSGEEESGETESEQSQTQCAEGSGEEESGETESEQSQTQEGSGEEEIAASEGEQTQEGFGVEEAQIEIHEESITEDKEGDQQQREGSKGKRGLMDYLRGLLYSCNVQSHNEVAKKTEGEDQSAGDQEQREGSKSKPRSLMDDLSSIMSAMLIPKYTPGEQCVFLFLNKKCTRNRKLPREWKCFLAYHRLAWNILYLTFLQEDVILVEGWQVQLIAWIFVCWEWRELITILIRKWNKLEVLRNWKSEAEVGPSLREIVEHYIEEELTDEKKSTTKKEQGGGKEQVEKRSGKLPEKVMTPISETQVGSIVSNMAEEEIKGVLPEEEMEGDDYLKGVLRRVLREQEEMREILRKSLKQQEEMREALTKSLKQQEEMRDMLKRSVLKEEDNKGESSKENRARIIKKYLIEEEECMEGESSMQEYTKEEEVEEWNRLKETLRHYNVSMDGIQAFQKFRFFCEAGHLPWPLPQQD